MSLEAALTDLHDWAAGVTQTREERERELVSRRNTANLAAVGIDVEALFA
jgi:hypothetical protein